MVLLTHPSDPDGAENGSQDSLSNDNFADNESTDLSRNPDLPAQPDHPQAPGDSETEFDLDDLEDFHQEEDRLGSLADFANSPLEWASRAAAAVNSLVDPRNWFHSERSTSLRVRSPVHAPLLGRNGSRSREPTVSVADFISLNER